MNNEIDYGRAREVYDTLISMLDANEWSYKRDDERLMVESGVKGEDLPINFVIMINPKNQVIQYFSTLPFNIKEDKRIDAAVAICVANYGLCDGSFDYDISDGAIVFRLTTSYRGDNISEELFEYIIMVASSTVDQYNDKFFMISKGVLSLEDFMADEGADK